MRIVGMETEYGILDPVRPLANPILMSSRLVEAARTALGPTARWDYGGEDPLHDSRGFRRDRTEAHPDLLTDEPAYEDAGPSRTRRRRRGAWEDPAHLNAVLSNGARFYVDHAHPEYSGPEVSNARDAVRWDRAGDEIARRAAAQYALSEGQEVALYKNNVDGKGSSYGTHENFQVSRLVPFADVVAGITPHLVTRQVFTGAGRVGLGQRSEWPGFQISQRADYIEAEIGLETTLRRPIVNTRDEPHADPRRWRRLHIIIGDANLMDVPNLLKLGTTSLVLAAIEAGDERLGALTLDSPVEAVQLVSRDLSLTQPLLLATGERASAVQVQRALLQIARDYATDAVDAEVVARWEDVLERLGRDIGACARDVEWVAKLHLLGRIRERHGTGDQLLPWQDPRLAAADLQWSDLHRSRGLCARLEDAGAIERLIDDAAVAAAVAHAPTDTRAHARGAAIRGLGERLDSVGWSTVVVDVEGAADLDVVVLDDPAATRHPVLDQYLADASHRG